MSNFAAILIIYASKYTENKPKIEISLFHRPKNFFSTVLYYTSIGYKVQSLSAIRDVEIEFEHRDTVHTAKKD